MSISVVRVNETPAIVLRTADHGESDRVITFLTHHYGKLRGIAKGAKRSRKRFVHSLEPCSLVDLRFREYKGFNLIESCKLIDPYLPLREDLKRWAYASIVVEIIDKMVPEEERHEFLFVLVKGALARLVLDSDPLNVLALFLIKLMDLSGYLPDFSSYITPHPRFGHERWWWIVDEGRLSAREREPKEKSLVLCLDLGTIALISKARTVPITKLWRLRIRQLLKKQMTFVLCRWVMMHSGKELKSFEVLSRYWK